MQPLTSKYAKQQSKKTLTIVLCLTLVVSLLLTFYNFQFNTPLSVASLTALDVACAIALILNKHGYFTPAAVLASAIILVTITINLYDGDGLFDPGILAYPLLITVGSMFMGKRSVLGLTISSSVSLCLIAFLQARGLIHVTVRANDITVLFPLLVLTASSGFMIWIIAANLENNLNQIQSSEIDLLNSYDMTLYGWAKALKHRDSETEEHSLRVVALSEDLARKMGCSEEEVLNIRRGAILHDIGKMGIPDHILRKPGPLDPDEWAIMRGHSQNGKEMLEGIAFLQPALTIVYCHHERWDGLGYPRGLKGTDIPLPARIFTIVDIWDALNSDRPYRKAWAVECVTEFIQSNAGTIFDPEIVQVFLQMDNLHDSTPA